MHRKFYRLIALLTPVLLGGLATQLARAEYQFQTIALSGQIAPGSGGSGSDVPFKSFSSQELALNDAGDVAFRAVTETNADGDIVGVFSTTADILHAVAFQGQIAPGSGGSGDDVPFKFSFSNISISDNGDVSFLAETMPNAEGGYQGIFSTTDSVLHAIAFQQSLAPGSGGSGAEVPFYKFIDISDFRPRRHVMNTLSEIAFWAETSANENGDNSGVFSTVGGTLHSVVFEGQIAPGSGGSGVDVPFIGFSHPSFMNTAGEIVFGSNTTTNDDGADQGIFSTAGGILHAVAFEGQIAPGSGGSGDDVPFESLSIDPSLNEVGEIAFAARTTANSDGNQVGVFSTAGGTLHSVAFGGQIAPGSGGSGDDVPFRDFFDIDLVMNDAGDVAFMALTEANANGGERGVFTTTGGLLHSVAFEGQIVQGSGGGGADVFLTGFAQSQLTTDELAFNAAGHVAFLGHTTPNANGGNAGILSTTGGVLHAVAFKGDQIEVRPDDFRTIELLSIAPMPQRFNDSGQVFFQAAFSDDTIGLILATPIPEPTTSALAIVVTLFYFGIRKI